MSKPRRQIQRDYLTRLRQEQHLRQSLVRIPDTLEARQALKDFAARLRAGLTPDDAGKNSNAGLPVVPDQEAQTDEAFYPDSIRTVGHHCPDFCCRNSGLGVMSDVDHSEFLNIYRQLTAEQKATARRLMQLAMTIPPPDLEALANQAATLSPDKATALIAEFVDR